MRKLFAVFVVCFLFSCSNSDMDGVSKYSKTLNDSSEVEVIYTHQYSRGYATLYPAENNLFYTDIQRVKDSLNDDSVKIKIIFKNTFSFFSHYVFTLNGKVHSTSSKNEFVFVFNKKAKQLVFQNLKVQVFTPDGNHSDFNMRVSYDPKIFFAQNGRNIPNNEFFVYQTDITFMEVEQAKFVRYSLTLQEKEEGRKEFAFNLNEAKSEKEKVDLLTRSLLEKLADFRGVPSDTMGKISPLQQYKRACGKLDEVWCGNLIDIYLYACACYDIKARLICLGNTYNSDDDPTLYHADHHSIAEVYYDKSWHLIDMSFYVMNARIENRSLNFVDFYYLINIPQERKKIQITYYDKESKEVREAPLDKAYRSDLLRTYYKQNQKFSFPYRVKDGLEFYWL